MGVEFLKMSQLPLNPLQQPVHLSRSKLFGYMTNTDIKIEGAVEVKKKEGKS